MLWSSEGVGMKMSYRGEEKQGPMNCRAQMEFGRAKGMGARMICRAERNWGDNEL
jgi:hypothetical protein